MIYLIRRIDFDNMENNNPLYITVEGYKNTLIEAEIYINNQTPKYYKGRDGEFYPKYKTLECNELK